ncbi:MAG: AsmA family protein [Geminicoccaceae bacterium]|nr:AsmA family protein [Geminicoccaceae bacterium]
MRKALAGLLVLLLLLPLVALGGLALLGVDRFRPWIERIAAAALERPVAIEGGLALDWSLPPGMRAEGLVLGPRPGESEPLARIGRLEVRLAILPLLSGRLDVDRLRLADATVALPGGATGRVDGEPGGSKPGAASAARATPPLPIAREVRLERVRVRLPAATGRPAPTLLITALDGALPDPEGPLRLEATGELDGRPWAARLALDSPGALLDGRPVRIEPLALELAGSDLEGVLALDPGGPRPRLEGRLESRRLELPLLAALFAGAEAESAGGSRVGGGDRGGRGGRVIPDLPIELSGLRGIEARLELRVAELLTGGPPLHELVLPVEIGNGRLVAAPIAAGLAGGRLGGRFEADGGQPQPVLAASLELRGVATARLQRELGQEPTVEAPLDLDLELTGRGRSLAALLAGAEGELTAAVGAGRVRALALDRIAGGVREAARALLSQGSEGWVELRCAVFDLPVRVGVAEFRVAVAETARARVTAEGRLDLGSERLDLTLVPRSRGATLNIAVPVRLRGTLAAPEIALDQREAARRAALGLLGALAFPPAAMAAFVDLGASGNPCLASEPPPAEGGAPAGGPALPGMDALRRGLEGLFGGGRR